jgi:hypothetical protein
VVQRQKRNKIADIRKETGQTTNVYFPEKFIYLSVEPGKVLSRWTFIGGMVLNCKYTMKVAVIR